MSEKLVRFDFAIKVLLRNKANFDILEGFLSELLKTDVQIQEVLESESNQDHQDDKYNRVDLLARTSNEQHVIIEVQCSNQWDYLSRILYSTSTAVCEYMRSGDPYSKVRKIISVSIVFFRLGKGKDYLYHGTTKFTGMHRHDELILNAKEQEMYGRTKGLAWETPEEIFPEYYLIKVPTFANRIRDKLDEWIYFLKHSKIEKNFQARGIQSAAHKLDVLRLTEAERRAYKRYCEGLHDSASWAVMMEIMREDLEASKAKIATAEAETEAAKAKIAATEAEIEAVRIEAKNAEARGREESLNAVAKTLLEAGQPLDAVVQVTGLSYERVRALGEMLSKMSLI